MKVNIERAIKSITEDIDFYQPLYEGIVNSYQADAKNIKINFQIEKNYTVGYSIEDDGEGFINDNIDSFLELWSDHKIEKGALGSGRILCLKVFDNIIISSQTKDIGNSIGQKVDINFSRNFAANTLEDINPIPTSSNKSFTRTEYKNINETYAASKYYNNTKEPFDIEKVKENIFIKLLPMFINFNETGKDFSITVSGTKWLDKNNLKEQFDKHQFKKEPFTIVKDLSVYDQENNDLKNEVSFNFTLLYRLTQDDLKQLEQFYGAADRYIHSFTKGVRLEKLPEGWSGIFCLTSKYLDDRVKDSRNRFNINETNASKDTPITFMEIKDELRKILNKILLEKFPETKKEFIERKQLAAEKFPHLSRYIKNIDNLTISESDILSQAEKEFNAEIKKVREEISKFTTAIKKDKKKFDEKAYEEITRHFTQVGREQLADYIGYRQTIIDMLLEIYDDSMNEAVLTPKEEDIHNLFMPQYKNSNNSFFYANNMWIFDDKFMSYNYSASDHTIEQIMVDVTGKPKNEIEEYQGGKKPDLVMFYSSDPENKENQQYDVLLVEFKRLNNGIDSKEKALAQLKKYPYFIKENIERVRSIHTYTIIDIDDEFKTTLVKFEKFKEHAFGDKENKVSAYYRYDEESNAHTHVVSFLQVIQDANKRNKVFLDILIQNFKYEE